MQLNLEGFLRDSYLRLDVISTNMEPVAVKPYRRTPLERQLLRRFLHLSP